MLRASNLAAAESEEQMKIKFIDLRTSPERSWVVDFEGAIRIVTRKTHEYLLSIHVMSNDGVLNIPVNRKEVFIDTYGELNITGWPR